MREREIIRENISEIERKRERGGERRERER
jgi:hypothetical protein